MIFSVNGYKYFFIALTLNYHTTQLLSRVTFEFESEIRSIFVDSKQPRVERDFFTDRFFPLPKTPQVKLAEYFPISCACAVLSVICGPAMACLVLGAWPGFGGGELLRVIVPLILKGYRSRTGTKFIRFF